MRFVQRANNIMTYRFTGKGLFILAGIISCMTVLFIPVGIIFFVIAVRAQIEMNSDACIYTMLTRRVIPYASITAIKRAPLQQTYRHVENVTLKGVAVLPLWIEYGVGKSVKISLNYFEHSSEIIKTLTEKTKLPITEITLSVWTGRENNR